VNPQFYDFFAIADPIKFTPYGLAYDYGSIMHYNAFISAVNRSKPTKLPKRTAEVGFSVFSTVFDICIFLYVLSDFNF
jgi:hypothetical protein